MDLQNHFSPFPVLHTKRLVLRKPGAMDIDTIFFQRSDPGVNQFIDREPAKTIEDAARHLEKITREQEAGRSVSWTIRLQNDTAMIGSICLWNFSEDRKTAEVGYDLHPSYQKKGFMTEALKAVMQFGFTRLSLSCIEAYTHVKNKPSRKMLEKAGFEPQKDRKDPENRSNRIYTIVRP